MHKLERDTKVNMSGDISHPSLNLTAEEKRVFGQLFQEADPDSLGIITGEVAVKFLERTRLDPTILGVIWQIGDKENRGLLTPAGFSVVLRLIGHAQAGRDPSVELLKSPGPLPKFEAIPSSTGITTSPQTQGLSGPIRVPPLTADKVFEYSSLFEKAGAQGGLLGGDAAREVFERARLPNEVLGQIWNLADTDQKGSLNVTDFVIAMHFLTSMRSGTMRVLPQSLPAGLYEAATKGASQHTTQNIHRPYSGNLPRRIQSPHTRPSGSPIAQQDSGGDWLVTPRDKAKFDEIFAGIDKSGQGYITGEQAVAFFGDSRLPEEVLAQIWDLSDINSEGRLTRDEFAVAMFLIRQERAQKIDNRGALPASLPAKLVPPSMRQQVMPPSQTTAPAFNNARLTSQQPKSAADDLFGLDALADDASVQPHSTSKGKESLPLLPSASSASSTPLAQGNNFKPFMPTSSFGQGLASQSTGASGRSPQSQKRDTKDLSEDLLGDNDPEISQRLTSDTSELANMSNRVTQLRTQMQDVQNKKTLNEQSLSSTTSQKKDLESRLAQIRTQYEKEIREVKSLEDRLTTSRNETRKLQQELAMVEGAHQDLLSQYQHIATSLEADQKENMTLKQRLQELTLENTQLKTNIESAKLEARQQRNVAVVSKKQVTTTEAENEKLRSELVKAYGENQEERLSQLPHEQDSTVKLSRPVVPSPGGTNPFSRNPSLPSADGSTPTAFHNSQKPNPFDSFFETEDSTTVPHPQSSSIIQEDMLKASDTASGPATPQTSNDLTLKQPEELNFAAATRSGQMTLLEPPFKEGVARESLSRSPNETDQSAGNNIIRDVAGGESLPVDNGTMEHENRLSVPTAKADVSSASGDTQEHENLSQAPALVRSSIPGAFPGEALAKSTPEIEASNGNSSHVASSKESNPTSTIQNSQQTSSLAAAKRGTEFPPIQDVEQEESDSDSDQGFEDDFSLTSPQDSQARIQTTHNTLDSRLEPDEVGIYTHGKDAAAESLQGEAPPEVGSQQSPPAYESAKRRASASNSGRDSNQFPQQYHGLLPSREITNSPPDEIVQNTPQTITSVESEAPDNSKQREAINSLQSSSPDSNGATAKAANSTPGDDFEDAFDGLSEAQEVTEGDFSEVAAGEETEFNPTFASSSAGHFASNDDTHRPKIENSIQASQKIPQDSFTSFKPSSGALLNATAQSNAAHDKSDWDAIFAGIDKPVASGETLDSKSPFDTVGRSNNFLSPQIAQDVTPAAADSLRPSLGRAISQGTEHDDPILKTLTNMGYPRDLALKALEKFDYNLDKAADHLASKS